MNCKTLNLTRVAILLIAFSLIAIAAAAARPPHPVKFPKPKEGMGRYMVVLWPGGTPVPGGDGKKHMGKVTEPDFVKLGGTVLYSESNKRVVDLPVKEAGKLKKHSAVSTMQRMWMGEPYSELKESPDGSNARFELETESDTDLTWGPKAYQYDGSGNIRAIGPDSFTYDTAGRLIQSTVGGKTETFRYDAFGNMIEKVVDGANAVTVPVDGASNRMIGVSYDAKGNVTSRHGGRTFTYDAMNMLSTDSGNSGRDMVYDADDERIGVIIDSMSRWWIRDFEGKVIREYQGQNWEQSWYWEQDWIYGEGQLVGGERVPFWWQNEENGRTYAFGGKRHYHLDHLGSVRMVSDDSGRSVSEHDYYAFGVTPTKMYQEQINWGDPQIDAMRFAGHQREFLGFINTENTEYLDYMHARYYDPNLGRFLSVDPVLDIKEALYEPQMWNRYSYVTNNPLKFTDPDGRYRTFYKEKPMTAENLAMDENTPAVVKASVYATGGLTALGAGGLFFAGGSGGGLAAGAFRLPPIARGNFIETALATAFGGGLPRTFPVIDRFLKGVATSVKSLDLASKTYQNAARLTSTLTGFVDKLAQFNGARLANVQVQGITQRVLEVVVQRGAATPQQMQAIQRAATYAKENDVILKVIMVQ